MRYLHLFLALVLVGLVGSVAWAQIPIGGGGGSVRGSGSTGQCAEWSNSNTLEASGASCGSGATYPTGSPPQITGFSALNTSESETVTGDCTFTRAGANSYTIACTKSSGTAFGTAAFQNTGTSGANLPFMNGANTWSGVQSITNADLSLLGSSSGNTLLEPTAAAGSGTIATFPANTGTVAELNLAQSWTAAQTYTNSDIKLLGSSTGATTFTSANAGGSNFTLTFPAATDTLVDLAGTQTLTNKSIAGTEINSGIVGATYGGSGVASPTAHSLLMGEGSSAFNLITATTSGDFIIDQGSGNDFAEEAMSGDCTLASTGAITCTKSSGSSFGTAAFDNTGTSGATIPLLNGANTWSTLQTFNNSDIAMVGSSTGTTTLTSANAGASNFTLTLPAITDTVVTLTATQTLTGKSIDASEINSGQLAVANGGTGDATIPSGKPLLGNGTGPINTGTLSGNTTVLATLTGAATSGDCVQFDGSGNIESAGGVCGGGGGGQPIYTHTLTESGGAATLVVQNSAVPYVDTDSMAMNGGATITTPASSGMADGEQILLIETTTGTSYTTTFAAGSGTSLASIVLGDAGIGSATACGTIPATGTQWYKFQYSLFNTTLTLEACGINIPPTSIASAVGGLGVSNPTAHGVLVGEGSAPVTPVGPNSTTGLPLISQGSTSDPVFAALNLNGPGVTGGISVATGGTGQSTLTAHAVIVGEGTASVAFATPAATGVPLVSNGSAADPSFAALSLSSAGTVSGALPVANGGTNLTTLTANSVILGEGTSSVAFATPAATGVPLLSNGTGADPTFGAVALAGASIGVTGTLSTTNGGTGRSNPTAHSILQAETSNPLGFITAATAGNIIVDQGSGADWLSKAMSADCTLAATGAITCTKSNGTAFGTAAFQNTGTSGANVPLLNGINTWSAVQTFSSAPVMSGASITANTVPIASLVGGTFRQAMSDNTAMTSYGGL